MPFELVDEPARIINAHVQPPARRAQERARQFAEFPRRCARRPRKLPATRPVDEAVFEVDADRAQLRLLAVVERREHEEQAGVVRTVRPGRQRRADDLPLLASTPEPDVKSAA